MELTTERLRLRQWCADDLPLFAALNGDARVMEFFPRPLSRAESDALAERCRSRIEKRGWGLWAVEEKRRAEFVGFVGLEEPSADVPCAPCVEVGWRLSYDYWGCGYATEAAQAAIAVGFDKVKLDEIVSFTAIHNLRSRAVMKRLGMVEDAATFEHPKIPVGHPLRKHCLYRLTGPRKARKDTKGSQ